MTRGIAITQWPVTSGKDRVRLHVRADFPAGWFQIKDRLAEMKEFKPAEMLALERHPDYLLLSCGSHL